MADQDFNIKVVTTADTSGIAQTEAALSRLRGGGYAQPFLAPIPEALLGGDIAEVAANGEKVSKSLNEAGGASLFLGANLTRARQESIILARELATGVPTVRTLGSLLGSLGTGISIAAVGGFALYKGFQASEEEAKKVTEAAKQIGDELSSASVKWQAGARSAITAADVHKLAAEMLPELDKIHEKTSEIQKKEITGWQSVWQQVARGAVEMSPWVTQAMREWTAPYTKALEENKKNAAQDEKFAESEASRAIQKAEREEATLETRKQEATYLKEIQDNLERLHGLQNALDKSADDYLKKWYQIDVFIQDAARQLKVVSDEQKKATSEIAKETAKEVKETAADMFKTPEQFNNEQLKAIDEHKAKIRAATAEIRQMQFEGGPKTEEEKKRFQELQEFTSPESEQRFSDSLKKRSLERYQALQETIIDHTRPLFESIGSEGEKKYRQSEEDLGAIHQRERFADPTGGKMDSGSREIVAELRKLADLWR